jgi:hypothetical protein
MECADGLASNGAAALTPRRMAMIKRTGSGSVWKRSLTLFEMTHGLCSCHSEQSEESFSILRVMVD